MAIEAFKVYGVIDLDTRPLETNAGRASETAKKLKKSIGDAEQGADRLTASSARLSASFSLTDDITGRLSGRLRDLVVATTGISGALQIGESVLDLGMKYRDSMNMLGAATQATAGQMERAGQKAKQLGEDVSLPATSAADAAAAMTELAKSGMNVEQTMEAARGALQLAAAAQVSEARAAEISSNALNTFKLQARDSTRVADLLAASANATSAEIGDMAAALQMSGSVAASNNVKIEELIAGLGLMANAGLKGSDAGTSFKTMLMKLAAPTDEAARKLEELKINIYDGHGAMLPFRDLVAQFTEKLAGMTQQQRQAAMTTIFQSDGIRAANEILLVGVDRYDAMTGAVTRSGAAADLAAARAQGLRGAWDAAKSQAEGFGLRVYELVEGPLSSMLRLVTAYPGIFTAAGVAVGGLTAAHVLYNSQLLITTAQRIPQLIASLRNTVAIMTSFSQVTVMSGTALATFALGWGAVIVAGGIAVASMIDWSTATERAANATREMVDRLAGVRAAAGEAATYTAKLASGQKLSAEEHKRLGILLGQLTPQTKDYTAALAGEKVAVDQLNNSIQGKLKASTEELEAKLRLFGAAVVENDGKVRQAEKTIKVWSEEVSKADQNQRIWKQTTEQAGKATDRLSSVVSAVRENLDNEYTPALETNTDRLIATAGALNLTRDALGEKLKKLQFTEKEITTILGRYDAWIAKNQSTTGALNQTTGAVNAQAEALRRLQGIMDEFNSRDQDITARVMGIVKDAKSTAEAIAKAKEAMRDPEFSGKVKGSLADKAEEEAARRAMGLLESKGGGGGGGAGRVAAAANREMKTQIGLLELLASKAERTFNKIESGQSYALERSAQSWDDYRAAVETALIDLYNTRRRVLDQEMTEVRGNKSLKGDARLLEEGKVNDKIEALEAEHQKRMTDLQREGERRQKELQDARLAQRLGYMQREAGIIEAVQRDLADRGVKSQEEAARQAMDARDRILQERERQLVGKLKSGLVDPNDRQKVREQLGQLLYDQMEFADEWERVMRDARRRDIEERRQWSEEVININIGVAESALDIESRRVARVEKTTTHAITGERLRLEYELKADKIRAGIERSKLIRLRDYYQKLAEFDSRYLKLVQATQLQIQQLEADSAQRRTDILEEFYDKQREKVRRVSDGIADSLTGAIKKGFEDGVGAGAASFLSGVLNMAQQAADELFKSELYKVMVDLFGLGTNQQGQTQGNGPQGGIMGAIAKLFGIGGRKQAAEGPTRGELQIVSTVQQTTQTQTATVTRNDDRNTDRIIAALERAEQQAQANAEMLDDTLQTLRPAQQGFWGGLASAAIGAAVGTLTGGFLSGIGGGGSDPEAGGAPPTGRPPVLRRPGEVQGGGTATRPRRVGHADGGYIDGAGSSLVDSIPAMLAPREFVLSAAATAGIGRYTAEYINRYHELPPDYYERRHFSAGGFASARGPAAVASQTRHVGGGDGAPTFVFNVQTPDAASFRRSFGQIMAEAGRHSSAYNYRYNAGGSR